jgi:hypothetical protein
VSPWFRAKGDKKFPVVGGEEKTTGREFDTSTDSAELKLDRGVLAREESVSRNETRGLRVR